MLLSPFTYLLWITATVLEVWLCVVAFRHQLFRLLPMFSSYLLLTTARELAWWGVVHILGYESPSAFYFAWVTQAILLLARGLAIGELCGSVLRPYRGVWTLAQGLLLLTAMALAAYAGFAARQGASWIATFILYGERGLELAAIIILVLLFIICRYYEIPLSPIQRMIGVGLGCYSAVQVANNTVLAEWLSQYFDWWNAVRSMSFQLALVIWWWALRRPLPAPAFAPRLLNQRTYDQLAPEVNYRLRVLNQRLLEILKP